MGAHLVHTLPGNVQGVIVPHIADHRPSTMRASTQEHTPMPITQDRMIAVLNAAQDYEQALQRAVALIRTHAQQAKDGVITWQEAMENTVMLVSAQALLTRTITTNKTLGAERQHFKAFARRNERSAKRMKEKRNEFGPTRDTKRQQLGIHQDYLEFVPAERTTAPREISREGRLYGSLLDDVDRIMPQQAQQTQGLSPETMAEIEHQSEAAVASHPGTVGQTEATEAMPGVDFEDEADRGTELDSSDRGEEG